MFLVSQVSGHVRKFNIGIYSDTMNVINVKLCMMVPLTELYLFVPVSVTLTIFQGHSNVKQLQLEILCSYLVKLKLCRIVR